ncbi:MAG: hypothetical protein HC924_19360 [Synechococcaceae cyanobacterium SM2_3_2]|nr:hypothetical protein [Synechococcaceae cyanobacterium SM2_3_2]
MRVLRRSRPIKLGVMAILGIPALIFAVQNWGTPVALVFLGQTLISLPLSLSLLAAYGLGGGLGMLLLSSWRFHDRVLLRKSQKQLELLNGRLIELERLRYRPNYSLPDQAQGSPIGSYSAPAAAVYESRVYEPTSDPHEYETRREDTPAYQDPDPYAADDAYQDDAYEDDQHNPNWQWYEDPSQEDPEDENPSGRY